MAQKYKAYVDTSAFISFLDRSDTYHPLFARLFADPPALITTTLVIAEGHGWFLRRYDADRGLQFLSFIEDLPGLSIVAVDEVVFKKSRDIIRKFRDQRLTLADAAGLSIMKTQRINSCWNTDRHLGLTGVPLAIHGA